MAYVPIETIRALRGTRPATRRRSGPRVSLRWSISLGFLAIAAVAMALVWMVFLTNMESALQGHAEDTAVGRSAMLAARIGATPEPRLLGRALAAANRGGW